jgi:hypothetical protein
MKHTPLPWRYQDDDTFDLLDNKRIVGANLISPALVFGGLARESEANAEFIVRACNAHYEMLEALKSVRRYLEQINVTSHQLNVAIAKAEGR